MSRGERFGFALSIRIDFTDGSYREFVTGPDWKVLPANDIFSPVCWKKPALSFPKGSPGPGEQPGTYQRRALPVRLAFSGFRRFGLGAGRLFRG